MQSLPSMPSPSSFISGIKRVFGWGSAKTAQLNANYIELQSVEEFSRHKLPKGPDKVHSIASSTDSRVEGKVQEEAEVELEDFEISHISPRSPGVVSTTHQHVTTTFKSEDEHLEETEPETRKSKTLGEKSTAKTGIEEEHDPLDSLLETHKPEVEQPESETNPSSSLLDTSTIEDTVETTPVDSFELDTVRAKAASCTPDTDRSSQSILNEIVQDLRARYPGKKIKVTSELVKKADNTYDPIPYQHPKKPDVTYYKTQVQYSFHVEGIKDEDLQMPSITRHVFTTATEPDVALLTAVKYAETVSELALTEASQIDKTRVEGIESSNYQNIMDSRAFKFKFQLDAAGKPGELSKIVAGGSKLKLKPDAKKQRKYRYAYDYDTGILTKEKRSDPKNKISGHSVKYFATEEEAILNIRHPIRDGKIFDRLVGSHRSMKELANELKEEIAKKEQEVAEYKAALFKGFPGKLFSTKAKTKKEFEAYLASLDNLEEAFKKGELSPAMMQYMKKKQALQQLKEKCDLDADEKITEGMEKQLELLETLKADPTSASEEDKKFLKRLANRYNLNPSPPPFDDLILAKETEQQMLEQAEAEIQPFYQAVREEQASFNRALTYFQRMNRELEDKVDHLKQAIEQAKAKRSDPQNPPSPAVLKKIEEFLGEFPDRKLLKSYLEKLEKRVAENRTLIKGLLDRLEMMGTNNQPISNQGVAADHLSGLLP